MNKVLNTLFLPHEITEFERGYVERLNRIGLKLYWLHLPIFVAIAYFNQTGPANAIVLTVLVLAGPTVAVRTLRNPRTVALVFGVTAMLMGGLLVHFGQGPVQIEMHFYFFALLAILAIYGNPMVVVVAAVTAAVHHLALWILLPSSVFNYDAPWWVVAVHAAFVVGESAVTCSMARSFFDNVIGLEKIVQARTAALDARNQDMRTVMDNVNQALLTVDPEGNVGPEYSAAASQWLVEPKPGEAFAEILSQFDPSKAAYFDMGMEQLRDGFMPVQVCLEQLPSSLETQDRHLALEYQPVPKEGDLQRLLIVISDVTSEVQRERLERGQRETMKIFEQILRDKAGFFEFYEEAQSIVDALRSKEVDDLSVFKRLVHTLKGNASLFHIKTVAEACHVLENHIDEENTWPSEESIREMLSSWDTLKTNLDTLLGDQKGHRIEVDDDEFAELLHAVLSGAGPDDLANRIAKWKLEGTDLRLERIAKQARSLAQRLDKPGLAIELDSQELLLDPRRWARFWASFAHAVRNAVDHGIESVDERASVGKPVHGQLVLRTRKEDDRFVVEIADDGRGVDWEVVRAKAQAHGFDIEDTADLKAVLFKDGFSTRDAVSEHSGRGVGMAALRQATEELGGSVHIDSTPGRGTVCRFVFPVDAMAPPPRRMLEELSSTSSQRQRMSPLN